MKCAEVDERLLHPSLLHAATRYCSVPAHTKISILHLCPESLSCRPTPTHVESDSFNPCYYSPPLSAVLMPSVCILLFALVDTNASIGLM